MKFLLGAILIFSILILGIGKIKADSLSNGMIDDFTKATVMVTNTSETSGGTGVIIKSKAAYSYVMTNAHVCSILENSGLVHTWKGKFTPQKYVKSKLHDLCMIKLNTNLEVNTPVADKAPEVNALSFVSGHPRLLPLIFAEGRVTRNLSVTMISEVQECSAKDYKEHGRLCWWFDGMPVIRTYDTKIISSLIAPGNSGSAVYNDDGEIIGVVFAGYGRGLTHAITVPHSYVKNFVNKEIKKSKWKKVKTSYRWGDRRRRRYNTGSTYPIDLDNIDPNVAFPAIFHKDTDKVYDLYQCIALKGKSCTK